MNIVFSSVIIVGAIGGVIGIILAIAGKIFHVKVDERVEIIHEMLPHFNCGACGTPGCHAFAQALLDGKTIPERCKPSKPEAIQKVKEKLAELIVED